MYPIVTFPILTIVGQKENVLRVNENYVTFKARENMTIKGNYPVRVFNAWDDIAERVKRLKLQKGSEVTIVAAMKNYIDNDGISRDSFSVMSIDYIRTNNSNYSYTPKSTDTQDNVPATPAPATTVVEEKKKTPAEILQEKRKADGEIDMDDFDSIYDN